MKHLPRKEHLKGEGLYWGHFSLVSSGKMNIPFKDCYSWFHNGQSPAQFLELHNGIFKDIQQTFGFIVKIKQLRDNIFKTCVQVSLKGFIYMIV